MRTMCSREIFTKKCRQQQIFDLDLKGAWHYNHVTFRAFLHEGGGPQVGEVTCGRLPHLTCKRDHIKTRDCMDRRVTSPKRVTSPSWGPPPPCKQALTPIAQNFMLYCRLIYMLSILR